MKRHVLLRLAWQPRCSERCLLEAYGKHLVAFLGDALLDTVASDM